MKIAVAGLWHLGTVTAACCASGGHEVIAFDDDATLIAKLQANQLPVDEPGLADLSAEGLRTGRLQFSHEPAALSASEVLWICYDTPVDENDVADTDYVLSRIAALLPYLSSGALIIISSQMPVGSTTKLEKEAAHFEFAYSPENLRLGHAINVFTKPDRVIVGVREKTDRARITALFAPFTSRLEWMSVESAEMTKHALNAFLATSVTFINEVAAVCEKVGADAQEVERGLKSDERIGTRAYLHPGSAFAGGTLARDLSFLISFGKAHHLPTPLFQGVVDSNAGHKLWAQRQLSELLSDLHGKVIGVLGITYKPGTNTLRRSSAMELCRWLLDRGAQVQAYDPAVSNLPEDFAQMQLMTSAEDAIAGADAVLVATAWPQFRSIPGKAFASMHRQIVLDPSRHLESLLKPEKDVEYFAIGAST